MDIVKILIDGGAHVNMRKKGVLTPLMRAARKGHIDIVKYLVEKGANPCIKDSMERTAREHAIDATHPGIVVFLGFLINGGALHPKHLQLHLT